MASEPVSDDDHLRLIQSDLHFRATQLRNFGVDAQLVRALMKAAFERFLVADAAEDKDRAATKMWSIYMGDREVATRHGNPELGRIAATTRVEAEKLAAGDEAVAIVLGRLGVPRGVGYWAVEIKVAAP